MIAFGTQHIDAAERMLWQLVASSIPRERARGCVMLYLDALQTPGDEAWSRFYRAVSQRLYECVQEHDALPPAAATLVRLLDDDFGRGVTEPMFVERISQALVEPDMREASLSS